MGLVVVYIPSQTIKFPQCNFGSSPHKSKILFGTLINQNILHKNSRGMALGEILNGFVITLFVFASVEAQYRTAGSTNLKALGSTPYRLDNGRIYRDKFTITAAKNAGNIARQQLVNTD